MVYQFQRWDGSLIRFWHDSWCGGLPLRESFLEFFCIASNKHAFVESILSFVGMFTNGMSVLFTRSKTRNWSPLPCLWI